MHLLLRAVPVPLLIVLLVLIAPPVAVGGLFLWASVGEVPFINVQFFPNEGSAATPTASLPAIEQPEPLDLTVTVPPGFTVEVVVEGLANPTAVVPGPGGKLFIAEKGGRVWVFENGARLSKLFIDLSAEVNDAGDRGLLGLAIDPNFEENGWVYLAFTVDPIPGQPDEPAETVTYARLVRYRATEESGRTVADPDSRQVLIGESAADGIPVGFSSHTVGDLVFGEDGMLFVSAGDGAHWDFVDYGQDSGYYDPLFESMFGPAQDIGAFRAQSLDSLAGKILRIDPATGDGLPTNPFFTGDPQDTASKVWALGFRNPYRFAVRPGTAGDQVLYVGDPGTSLQNWEEINAISAGANGGWPCFEGGVIQEDYWSEPEARQRCETLAREDTVTPVLRYNRAEPGEAGFVGSVVVGGLFYDAPSRPEWDDLYLFADYGEGFIRALRVDGDDQVSAALLFATGMAGPVDLAQGDSGQIYVVEIGRGRILKIAPEDR